MSTRSARRVLPDHPGVPGAEHADPLIRRPRRPAPAGLVQVVWATSTRPRPSLARVEQICDELIDDFIERSRASYELSSAPSAT
jgi:hypothetical protein